MLPGIYSHSRKLSRRSSISVLPGRDVNGSCILPMEMVLGGIKRIGPSVEQRQRARQVQGSPTFLWLTL